MYPLFILSIGMLFASCAPELPKRRPLTGEARTDSIALAVHDDSMATVEHARRAARLFEADGLAVTSAAWERSDAGNLFVAGTVENAGPARSYASVTFAIYNASGAVVGSALDNVAHVDERGTWRFRALVSDEGAHTFRVTNLAAR